MTTGLKHIEDGYVDPKLRDNICTTFKLGPLTIKACVDPSVPSILVTAYLFDVEIGHWTLDREHTSCTFGGSVAGYKVEGTLTADFDAKKLTYAIELCLPLLPCKDYSGTIVSW